MKTFDELQFVRITDPNMFSLIPRKLFDQVKGSEYKIDRIYQFGAMLLASPLTFFYLLLDKDHQIGGILWAEMNPLDDQIKVHAFSVDKEYQQNLSGKFKLNSRALKTALELLRKLQKDHGLDSKIEIVTLRPRAYEKAGWKRSKKCLMEI